MFANVKNFFYRHRRKFLIGSSIVGGIVLLSRYAENKLFEWHAEQTRSLVERQKRRQHFESTRQTANATALNLSVSISKVVNDELEVESILHSISTKPELKRTLWQELKILGFSRSLASVYVSALVGSIVHVSLMILGGYAFSPTKEHGAEDLSVNAECREKFLSHLQAFIEKGLPSVIAKIRGGVYSYIHSIPLNQPVSLEYLEALLKDVTLLLDGEKDDSNGEDHKLSPWSQYVTNYHPITNASDSSDIIFQKMTLELADIIDGEDFNTVVRQLVQHGISHIVDHVADSYPSPSLSITTEEFIKEKNSKFEEDEQSTEEKSNLTERIPPSLVNPLTKATLPLAKLIPILSDLVRPCLSPAPGQLLQFVLLNEQLENLSFNIYEAFSVHV